MAELERRGAPPEMVRAIASHADFLGVAAPRRRWRRRCSPSTSCRGFLVAVRVRAPRGHPRPDAQVGQEEAQAAVASPPRSTARRCATAPSELGVDFDEHVAFVIAALEERAGELGLEGEAPAARAPAEAAPEGAPAARAPADPA